MDGYIVKGRTPGGVVVYESVAGRLTEQKDSARIHGTRRSAEQSKHCFRDFDDIKFEVVRDFRP